jgi:hypothetical protein
LKWDAGGTIQIAPFNHSASKIEQEEKWPGSRNGALRHGSSIRHQDHFVRSLYITAGGTTVFALIIR